MKCRVFALACALLIAEVAPAQEFRSKPGTPRAAPPTIGAVSGAAPPDGPIGAEIGVKRSVSEPPQDLRSSIGAADYGFNPLSDEQASFPASERRERRLSWPNK